MEADGQDSAICPGCQPISRSRHSRYWRSLRDLPVQGTQVILRLHLGRWRCRNAVCERRIFTEPLSKVCAPYARQTKRAGEIIAVVGRALGGRPGQRLMSRLGMPVSADTLIRQVKRAARLPALPQLIRVLGVDDWAWCKGQTFGTNRYSCSSFARKVVRWPHALLHPGRPSLYWRRRRRVPSPFYRRQERRSRSPHTPKGPRQIPGPCPR